jgi:hypothetical protein
MKGRWLGVGMILSGVVLIAAACGQATPTEAPPTEPPPPPPAEEPTEVMHLRRRPRRQPRSC